MSDVPPTVDDIYINQAFDRFAQAAHLQYAIHAIKTSAPPPGATPEQLSRRAALIEIMSGMLTVKRDELVKLGIYEWRRAHGESEDE